jgi:hypothetical protein
MSNRRSSQAVEYSDEVGQPEAQASRSGLVIRAKTALLVGVLAIGIVATVLWCVMLVWGLLWLLF